MKVGEDVTLRGVEGWEELEGQRAEAILYDYYEKLYTVVLHANGQRVEVSAACLRKK